MSGADFVLGLGTAQFGLDYGIANRRGRPSPHEIERILRRAEELGFGMIDTAPSYGDSEQLIGRALPNGSRLRIVTKTHYLGSGDSIHDEVRGVRQAFEASLRKLNRPSVYGLLIHSTQDVGARYGGAVIEAMRTLKDEGRVERIGVSVYAPEDIDDFAHLSEIDIVQLPLNVLDQRFARSGYIASLKRLGIEIHTRSAFLQGALLLEPAVLPPHLEAIHTTLARLHFDLKSAGVAPLAAALSFLKSVRGIDCVVVGTDGIEQLEQIASAVRFSVEMPFDTYACEASYFVEPRHWPATQ